MAKVKALLRNQQFNLLLVAGIFAVLGFSMFLTTTTSYAVTAYIIGYIESNLDFSAVTNPSHAILPISLDLQF